QSLDMLAKFFVGAAKSQSWLKPVASGFEFLAKHLCFQIHFTILAGILFAVASAIFVVVSLRDEAPTEAQLKYVYQEGMHEELVGTPWWKSYKVHMVVILILTAALVIGFW
ncbi:MAG: hypothetical protein AAGJ35_15470, partial [Myxococcota bacterium]